MICYLPLAKKMYLARFKEYRLFWCCQAILAAIIYAGYSFISDASFLYDTRYVPVQISQGSIQICFYGICAVMILFLPLSHWILFKNRSEDFFTLLSIGFTKENMYEQMIVEHLVMDITALFAGLLAGTGLSFLLYAGMVYGFGYEHFKFPLHLASYVTVMKGYMILDAISIVGIILGTCHFSIGKIGHLGRIGRGKRKKTMQLSSWYEKKSAHHYLRVNHFMQLSVIFIFSILILTQVLLIQTIADQKDDCKQSHPFDLVYVDDGIKKLELVQLDQWIKVNDIKIKSSEKIKFYRDQVLTLVNVEQINRTFHTNYKVSRGKFLRVNRQLYGYFNEEQTKFPFPRIQVKYPDKLERMYEQGAVHHLLYGFSGMSDFVALIHPDDYRKLKKQNGTYIPMKMYAWNFKDQRSERKLTKYMEQTLKDDAYSAIDSKCLEESSIKENEKLSVAFFLNVSISIYFACIVMIHFVIRMERIKQRKEEQILFELGMKDREIRDVRRYWCKQIFFMPIGPVAILAGMLAIINTPAVQFIVTTIVSYLFAIILLVITQFFIERCYERVLLRD